MAARQLCEHVPTVQCSVHGHTKKTPLQSLWNGKLICLLTDGRTIVMVASQLAPAQTKDGIFVVDLRSEKKRTLFPHITIVNIPPKLNKLHFTLVFL